jgi:hypothetical protein
MKYNVVEKCSDGTELVLESFHIVGDAIEYFELIGGCGVCYAIRSGKEEKDSQ